MEKKKKTSNFKLRNITKNSHRDNNYKNKSQFHDKRQKKNEINEIKQELMNFARTDWGQRWVKAILEYGRPYRMQRGLRYAEEDRISNLVITPGLIFTSVQGTAPTPYRVKVIFDVISEKGWSNIINQIVEKANYTIQLLENKMPMDFEEIFASNGFPLFPSATRNLNAKCSCPDSAVPCKHIAATILYIARVVDFDPFLLLKLRGKNKVEILNELQHARSCSNQPISKSIKNIREITNFSEDRFDVPSIPISELQNKDFTKNQIPFKVGFHFKKPSDSFEILANLGNAPNSEYPELFNLVFSEIYSKISKKVYTQALESEKKN